MTLVGTALPWLTSLVEEKIIPGALSKGAQVGVVKAYKSTSAAVMARFNEGKLPANHDLARASRHALVRSLLWMARELDNDPSSETRGTTLAAATRGATLNFQSTQSPEHREWVAGLRELAYDDKKMRKLEHRNLDGLELERMLKTQSDRELAEEVHQRVRTWLRDNLGHIGEAPAQLDNFLGAGWAQPGGTRLTLYQAWCSNVREALKGEEKAFNAFVSTAVADLLDRPVQDLDAYNKFDAHLASIQHKLDELAVDVKAIHEMTADMHRVIVRGKRPEPDDVDLLAHEQPLNAAQSAMLAALLRTEHGGDPDAQVIAQVIHSPVTGLRSYLLHRYALACRLQNTARWMDSGEIRMDIEFVDLELLVATSVDEARIQRWNSLGEVLERSTGVDAWVLTGEAGGGKSTLLRHHEMACARKLLIALNKHAEVPRQELCVCIRLASYRRDKHQRWPDCEDWLKLEWRKQMPSSSTLTLDALREKLHVRFLLDGINEIEPGIDPATRREAMRQFSGWVAHRGRLLPPVFSVRRHERGVAMLNSESLALTQIDVVRLSPERIEQFCMQNRPRHDALWERLQRDPTLLSLCQNPFNLAAHAVLHEQDFVPSGHADLFLGLVWLSLRRAVRAGDVRGGLLTQTDDELIADNTHWKEAPRVLPRDGPLIPALEEQAYRMAHAVEVAEKDAEQFAREGFDRAAWLAAVQALGLVEIRMNRSGKRFAFSHQLWQEFFLALGLRDRSASFAEMAPVQPGDLRTRIASLAAEEPLPRRQAHPNEEAVKLAAQLAMDPDDLVRSLVEVHPALAGRVAASCLANLEDATVNRLRTVLIAESRRPQVDIQLRIESAEALGLLSDTIRYEHIHQDPPCMLPRRTTMPEAGVPSGWVAIAGGRYAIGSQADDPEADADERGPGNAPVHVDVAAFEMAYAPVTNAEFALFIRAGGYADERWWREGMPSQWRRGGLRDDAGRAWQMLRFDAIRNRFDEAMKEFFHDPRSPANLAFARSILGLTDAELTSKLDTWYPWSGSTPAFMGTPNFSNPLQPVVGVSLFEAEAYCRWLSSRTGETFRLPTEAEWEAAARGTERRRWPWGDEDPALDQLNAEPLRLQRPAPVGVFASGDTPKGLTDMAGNVWEWTSSPYAETHTAQSVAHPADTADASRALRGGAYHFIHTHCRAAYRYRGSPLLRNEAVGFRIVRQITSSES